MWCYFAHYATNEHLEYVTLHLWYFLTLTFIVPFFECSTPNYCLIGPCFFIFLHNSSTITYSISTCKAFFFFSRRVNSIFLFSPLFSHDGSFLLDFCCMVVWWVLCPLNFPTSEVPTPFHTREEQIKTKSIALSMNIIQFNNRHFRCNVYRGAN